MGYVPPPAGAGGAAVLQNANGLPVNSGFNLGAGGSIYSTPLGGSGFTGNPATNPAYQGYGYGANTVDPWSYLYGASSVIKGQAEFAVKYQESRLLQQQVERERIATRKQQVEEWLWEQKELPTPSQIRAETAKQLLARSMTNPPINEILSSTALNVLLDFLKTLPDKGNAAPQIALDKDTVDHINVTPSRGGNANFGLLRNDGSLSWPLALGGAPFQKDRETIDQMLKTAVKSAKAGNTDAGSLRELNLALADMNQQLKANLKDSVPQPGTEARRFLSNLDDAVRILERADAKSFFKDYVLKANNVADLFGS